ncbi:C13 family peptidase [Bradyrhizobium neotropicale]
MRHKVVVISACYSGVFVPRLANPYLLVITAADADHPSFGCPDKASRVQA